MQLSDISQTEKYGTPERHGKTQLPHVIKMHTIVRYEPRETIMWKIMNTGNVFFPISQSSIKLVCQMSKISSTHASRLCSGHH